MAAKTRELMVFAWLPEKPAGRFAPAGLLQLTEVVGANPQNRDLTSQFAYGLGYLKRREAVEVLTQAAPLSRATLGLNFALSARDTK